MSLAVLAQVSTQTPTPISAALEQIQVAGPSITGRRCSRCSSSLVGGLLLLTFSSPAQRAAAAAPTPATPWPSPWPPRSRPAAVGPGPGLALAALVGRPPPTVTGPSRTVGGAVGVDGFSLFLTIIICVAVVARRAARRRLPAPRGHRRRRALRPLLLSAAGGVVMAMANDLIVLFLGLETLSIAVYVLRPCTSGGSSRRRPASSTSCSARFSSAFFLYGIALVYGATGRTNLVDIKTLPVANVLDRQRPAPRRPRPAARRLRLQGRRRAVPLVDPRRVRGRADARSSRSWPRASRWPPSPASCGSSSSPSRHLRADWQPDRRTPWPCSRWSSAPCSPSCRPNVKRMLAYSSISHAGFILVAVEAGTAQGTAAVLFYLVAYTFMVAGSFGVVTLVGRKGDGAPPLDDYRAWPRSTRCWPSRSRSSCSPRPACRSPPASSPSST